MKGFICQAVLWFLYRGMDVLVRDDARVKAEIERLPEGCVLRLKGGMQKHSPQIVMRIEKGRIVKAGTEAAADLTIVFKNIHMAFKVLTGQISIEQAYARRAFYLKGNINAAMGVVRCVEYVELYLFPKVMAQRILKRVEKKHQSALAVYGKVFFGRRG